MGKLKTISLVSTKGGVGKSSTTILLANYLAASGKNVLVVDTDYSNSTTLYYLQNRIDMQHRGFTRAMKQGSICENIVPTQNMNIDILPSNDDIDSFNLRDPDLLKSVICNEEKRLSVYDYILIDTSQGYNSVVVSAILASDIILTPVMLCQFDLMSGITLRAKIMDDCDKYDAWYLFFNGVTHHIENPNSSQYQYITLYRKTFPNCMDVYVPRTSMVTNAIDRALKIRKEKNEKLFSAIAQLGEMVTGEKELIAEAM